MIEAMHLGLACLVFNVSYNLETTSGKAVYFSNERDIKNCISDLWNDELMRVDIGKSLKEVARVRYSWSEIIGKYDAVFSSFK